MTRSDLSRRRFLAATGATAAITALAGCGGGGDGGGGGEEGDTPTPTGEGEETPTETEAGGGNETNETTETGGGTGGSPEERLLTYLQADPTARGFQGEIVDEAGSDEVTVKVGAGSDGLAFDPAALRVNPGTTIVWEWTGQGGAHNVSSTTPDTYEGNFQSDFEFRSGDPTSEQGNTFEQSFDQTGVGLYRCEPHASVGMKGGFVVVE